MSDCCESCQNYKSKEPKLEKITIVLTRRPGKGFPWSVYCPELNFVNAWGQLGYLFNISTYGTAKFVDKIKDAMGGI